MEKDTSNEFNASPQAPPKTSPNSLENDTSISTAHNIGEAETNRRLAIFEKAHRWDPNIDDSQLEEINDATNVRYSNTEGIL